MLKVFDDSVRDEIMKSLTRVDMELSTSLEGKDIKIKLGTSRKEHVAAGLKKVKTAIEDRVQRLGCGGIIRPVQHMVQLVRIFACDMAKRDGGKTALAAWDVAPLARPPMIPPAATSVPAADPPAA